METAATGNPPAASRARNPRALLLRKSDAPAVLAQPRQSAGLPLHPLSAAIRPPTTPSAGLRSLAPACSAPGCEGAGRRGVPGMFLRSEFLPNRRVLPAVAPDPAGDANSRYIRRGAIHKARLFRAIAPS